MGKVALALALVALSAPLADGKPKPKRKPKAAAKEGPAPAKGFWKILVKPNQKWTLTQMFELDGSRGPRGSSADNAGEHVEPITIETYDVRKVGDADVARLRWRQGKDSTDSPLAFTHAPKLDQFAVTDAGLYILTADMDDAKIAEVLKTKKPSRSDPPKPYKGTKLNEGRYLELRDGLVCMGQGPAPGDPECEDTCEGAICIHPTDGIVRLEGNWAPDMFDYITPKYK